jgi:hypothetical protein
MRSVSSIDGSLGSTQASLDRLERFARFALSAPGQSDVAKLFPKLRVAFQVNQYGRFLAFFIDEELDALH